MGNKLARTTQVSPSEYYLHDLPSSFNLVLKEVLGSDRFFKAVLCVHDEGLLLVKVYFKRGESLSLKEHERKVYEIREKLRNVEHSHVWPFQDWHETDKAAYLLRQYFFSNLHDRISTRPFLSMIEKKWLAFQLLHAVKQSHDRGVCHGDIKCENVLVTSWNWVYLTDYASFKPTYIPDDNPADFSFFFDTGGRRRCYLAPERFYDPKIESLGTVEAPLKPSMDMFSLGCVIAELFLEGQALFDLSQLLAYRKRLYDPRPSLEKVPDSGIRNMILQMTHLNPESRLSPDDYLQTWSYDVFPAYFSPALHNLFSCLTVLDSDTRVAVTQGAFPEIRKQMIRDAKSKEVPADTLDKGGGLSSPAGPENTLSSDRLSQRKGRSLHGASKQDLVSDINSLLREDNHPKQQGRHHSKENANDSSSVLGCSYRVKAASIKMAEAASVQEVVTEEMYENNLREPNGTFGDRLFYTADCLEYYKVTGAARRKEDITLPSDGGWTWEGDWEIDFRWSPVDNEGWRYCRYNTTDPDYDASESNKFSPRERLSSQWPSGWSSVCTSDCLWRQRRWTRRRRKNSCHPLLLSNEAFGDCKTSDRCTPESELRCEGMVLIASLLCACLRNVRLPQARRATIQLLHDVSILCDDDARLQLIVPYVAAVLSDPAAIVRCAALQTLCNVLSMVQIFPPSDAKVFPEYIFPLLSMLPDDPEESVRICYSDCIHKIANTAYRFLDSQYTGLADGLARHRREPNEKSRLGTMAGKHDMELAQLRETIARVIHDLVMGQKQTPTIRRALLQHIGSLCEFFGRKQCNDFLLPILPAFLNDRDKQLRAVFFEQIVHVCVFVGQVSSEAYLLPYLEQALSNVEETVIVNALECIAALCVQRLLRNRVLLKTVERACPLLCHPSQWVRRAAITLVAASGSNLDPADAYAYLLPLLSPFLRREPLSLFSEAALLACLKPPVSREVFQRVLSDVMLSFSSAVASAEQHPQARMMKAPESLNHGRVTSSERGRLEADGTRPWSAKSTPLPRAPSHKSKQQVTELEDGEKMRAMEGYIRNLSSTMHSWDLENPEKLETSGVTPAGFFSNYDVSTDGIPLYSLPVSEKRLETSGNEEWNRVYRQSGGLLDDLASSQWATIPPPDSLSSADILQKSTLTFPSRLSTGSIYGGAPLGSRKGYDSSKDAGRSNEQAFASSVVSVLSSKSKAWPAFEGNLQRVSTTEPSGEPLSDAFIKFLKSTATGSSGESCWRPRGVLVAHLQEHQRAVNEVAVSSDNVFFATASDDGVVKIWDCRRLERDTSFRSRLNYSFQGERVLHLAMLTPDHQVAAASNSGQIHVFCVDYTARVGNSAERYSGISNVRKVGSHEGAIMTLQNFSGDGPSMLLYSTQRNGIHLWDLRTQNDVWLLKVKPEQGYLSGVAVDPSHNWLVSGTSRGVLTLWDLRFQIPVYSWQLPSGSPVEAMTVPCGVSPSRPFVYVAAGRDEVAVWNAENGICQQVLRSDTHDEATVPFALQQRTVDTQVPSVRTNSKQQDELKLADYRVGELNDPPPRLPGVRALLPSSNGVAVLTGGTDCKIRMWDHLRPECSYCVCGPTGKNAGALNAQLYVGKKIAGVHVTQELCSGMKSSMSGPAIAATDMAGCHRDSVSCLALAQTNQRLLISCSRDGAVKVWK